ncbi:MAG: CotH kinase family protein [Fibrobacter sp.]|nr:CotH kinase family protein [Fibrobacter sp.]
MHILGRIFKLYLASFCIVCFFACSDDGSNTTVEEAGTENNSTVNSGSSIAPGDSAGYTRVITENGDTIYVKDTVTVYPDTTLRWIGNSAVLVTEIASLNLDWLDLDGDDPSWVEVYNSGTVSANLKGWALVENLKEPRKWIIGDEVIAAKSFRTIFCDKKNIPSVAGVGDGKDADGKVLRSRPHTNWKMDKKGGTIYLVDPSNGIRDSVAYPQLAAGVSWGIVDGGSWKYFAKPTPERPNTESTAYDGMAPTVDFSSVKAGFYDGPEVTINPPSVESGATIRCTTDGSVPTASSEEFNSPKTFSKNTPFRCSVFKNGTLTKEVVTKTIFVGETVRMPVVAVTAEPEFLTNYYKQGYAGQSPNHNLPFYQDKEFPVHIEYFEKGSSTTNGPAFGVNAGLSFMGNWSRMEDKKSVAIVMREEYQDGKIKYPLFETRKETASEFRGFNLRNNGNRYVSDYLEDAMAGALLEGTNVDYQRSRQVVVFYNGKYYGIHDMRERFNKHYVETNYGIDANSVEVIKHLGHEITSNTNSTKNWTDLLDLVNKNDAVSDADYATVKTMMDVGSFAEYIAFEIYMHNGDWPDNNVRAWRSPDHPYKFMAYDLDHGMDWTWRVDGFWYDAVDGTNMFDWIAQGGNKHVNDNRSFASIFNHLIKNANFKRLFINHSAILFQNYVNSARVSATLDAMAATLNSDETERDLDEMSRRGYENACHKGFDIPGSCMKTWAEDRDGAVIDDYKKKFGLGGMITVKIDVSGKGSVLVDGMKPPSTPYSGKFFSGNQMELSAVAASGATFTGWNDGVKDNPRIVSPTDGATYTATFK